MDSFFQSALRAAVLVLVVGPATAWIARHAAKERRRAAKSLKTFTVQAPVAARLVIMICAVVAEVVMTGVYVWQGLSQGIWDGQLVWLGHGLALVFLFVWAMMTTPRIDVAEDVVTARSAIGRRRSVAFSQIDRAEVHLQMRSLTVFAEGVKFAKVSLESTCVSNLLARFAEEGVEVADAVEGPMTKWRLCWAAIRPLVMVLMGIAVASSVLLVFMCAFGGVGTAILWFVPFLIVFVGIALPLFMLIMPLRGIYVLGQQERELGFDFGKEMLARGATGTTHEDDDWFVDISNARVVAFRRDYVKRITSVEGSGSGDRCTVLSKSGRKHRVYAAGSTLEDLRRWFRNGPRAKSMADSVEDALETIA